MWKKMERIKKNENMKITQIQTKKEIIKFKQKEFNSAPIKKNNLTTHR